ncbi:cyclopropane-fatty-acyl-phospholipid synthase family protein [Rhodococcus sp. 14-2483-1-1]|uniref:SAM-dependent methyltransferase n=1 Tax=Rhodococcus sp. 14-2483-1-1 TaxID=2023148 RepID=UPI0020164A8F|nr:cyclopropane-fatty-acyl-phospholipid synthase family protein [Rhodococcus sp. 14-2483-1-1]
MTTVSKANSVSNPYGGSAVGPLPSVDARVWPQIARVPGGMKVAAAAPVADFLFRRAVEGLQVRVAMPDGEVIGAGSADAPLMTVYRPHDFAARVGDSGLIGFGEAYMAGDWDAEDLTAVLEVFARRMASLIPKSLQRLRGLYVPKPPRSERNTTKNTRSNISRHYDLSNDLFELFLDETMTYSSALFAGAGSDNDSEELADAQRRKIDRLLDRAGVGDGSRVLEIGTGWGELAIRAAARGATVRSVTLSTEQQELARKRCAAAGYGDRIQIDLLDYRLVDGEYDAIVSVEMIEAVGHQYWGTYFETIDSLLAPGGRVALQAITMPHDRMLATRNTYTWVHKYIFPGGFLPSVRAIEEVTEQHTSLRVRERLSMGDHYARTLALWDSRFREYRSEASDLGFDEVFARMWHFYLCYSEAGFRSGYLDVQQIVLDRRDNR